MDHINVPHRHREANPQSGQKWRLGGKKDPESSLPLTLTIGAI